jgi:hypothetical protein
MIGHAISSLCMLYIVVIHALLVAVCGDGVAVEGKEEMTKNDGQSLLQHNPESLLELYNNNTEICSNPKNNIVLQRRDSYFLDLNEKRVWSMHAKDVFDFANIDLETKAPNRKARPSCNSAQEVIDSVAYPIAQEPCQIAWYSRQQVCDILHQYSLVWWSGDSLTRQQTQGLLMLLTNDLRFGGIPLKEQLSQSSYEQCGCDGLFSESLKCREFMFFPRNAAQVTLETTFALSDWSDWKLCSTYTRPRDRSAFVMDVVMWSKASISCPLSKKPIFIMLQFGHHCHLEVGRCTAQATDRMNVIQTRLKECMERVKIVYVGATVCSDAVVRKYPHQNKGHILDFNAKMKQWFTQHHPEVLHVQYWNVSNDASARTSDGFHPLSDINLLKAVTTLNIMHHIAT